MNEAFVKNYGWSSAVGQRLPGKNFDDHEIIGVVKDFNYASLYDGVQPLAMAMNMSLVFSGIENVSIDNSSVPRIFLRLQATKIPETIEAIEATYKQLAPGENFSFSFVDDAVNQQSRNDENLARIIQVATILSVIIGSLGLYALASLSMQSRVREISIRKVLGATSRSLLFILLTDFMAIIMINLFISVPFTITFMQKWLESFKYRIDIDVETFLVAGSIAILIGLITISYQAIKVALVQPAQTLKNE